MIYDQCKTCRRLGQKLFLKGDRCLSQKCAMVRRAYAPGPQKKRRGGSPSEYKKSLYEKQTLKKLESRLDNVIFRLGFVNSRIHARQLVSHGYFLVNGKPVNIPSFNVKKGDIISIKESKKKKPIFKELQTQLKRKEAPLWLNLDRGKFEGKSVGEPNLEEVKPPAEIPLIFEFYSR